MWSPLQGVLVGPQATVSVVPITPNSEVVARPTGTMPQARTRRTSSDCTCATHPSARRLPASVGPPGVAVEQILQQHRDAVERPRLRGLGRLHRIVVQPRDRAQARLVSAPPRARPDGPARPASPAPPARARPAPDRRARRTPPVASAEPRQTSGHRVAGVDRPGAQVQCGDERRCAPPRGGRRAARHGRHLPLGRRGATGPEAARAVRPVVARLPALVPARRRAGAILVRRLPARRAHARPRAGARLRGPGRAGRRRRPGGAVPVAVGSAAVPGGLLAGGLDARRQPVAAAQLRLRPGPVRDDAAHHHHLDAAHDGDERLPVGRAGRRQRGRPGGGAGLRRAPRGRPRLRGDAAAALHAGAVRGRAAGARGGGGGAGQPVVQHRAGGRLRPGGAGAGGAGSRRR